MRCCCGKYDIDEGDHSLRINDIVHRPLMPDYSTFCGHKNLQLISQLTDALENVMGRVDGPVARRRLKVSEDEEFMRILQEAREAILESKEEHP